MDSPSLLKQESLRQLKERHSFLLNPENLRPLEGLATGNVFFDEALLWKGIPKGELSLFFGPPGSGATSLWVQVARQVHLQDRWAAWMNAEWSLLPQFLVKKGLNLHRLLVANSPEDSDQLLWILQEMISSSLFEVIGCSGKFRSFKNHQLKKLKKLARQYHVALVFIFLEPYCSTVRFLGSIFGLIVECHREGLMIHRALHRLTPFTVKAAFFS